MIKKLSEQTLPLEKENAVLIDFDSPSDILMVTFGGMAKGVHIPVFEFFDLLSKYNLKKCFIRDFAKSMYQRGLKDISHNVETTAAFLQEIIDQQQPKKVVFIGTSAGGTASILFGKLLNVTQVIAIAPITFCDSENRARYDEDRHEEEIGDINRDESLDKQYFDLQNVMQRQPDDTVIDIYYCINHALDKIHAERMGHYDNVNLFAYEQGGHGIIRHLYLDGTLERIIKQAATL